ncbi:short-chain dehydrogenase [Paucilactobacillus hokkaidonensis JCM 18461]|uniref:Short-chain dehydrogenase n=2 Tax=Paucilactobacillus hokkaidonensis TaxID=1193095 RepID=A0A0A1GVM4_9LACO|nr:SDR family oxidoreductase [Paucilactobacillus hokkaidonensis]KRO08140.1 short-chain dehydrogenase oxidoreductase [Paucilactobacillus hokkaidonensis]BAP84908.1 short-chain dehydrogenase [Paucilactobacillus hokkaidonensis JCM 18461]
MEQALQDKRILVLGGTSGLGKQISVQSLVAGANVTVIGRNKTRLNKAVRDLNVVSPQVTGESFDVSDQRAFKQFLNGTTKFDHIVSMLGGAMGGGFLSSSVAEIRAAIEQKFFVNLIIAQTVVPYLNEYGSLIFTGGAGGHPYDASGAIIGNQAIKTMVEGLAVEAAPKIRVNAVAPTWTPTGLWRELDQQNLKANEVGMISQIPLKRVSKPQEVASAYLFLMQNKFVTGQVINVDGGISVN